MNCEFMIASTPLSPSMPLPKAMLRFPVSSMAEVMYARLLDEILTRGTEDSNGILFICFSVMEIAAALSRSLQTCKRSLNELKQAGMIMCVCQGIGEVSHMYILLPKEDAAHE
ncbi:DeoR family transcriptional regulator [Lachnospiraceae bacterium 45-P1]